MELIANFFSSIFGYSETLFNIIELIADVFLDILKTLPILFLVYLLLEVLNKRFENKNIKTATLKKYGPLAGAIVGTIPQCGFSSAAAALYKNRAIGAATLISVFISTSDEALPIMLSYPEKMPMVLLLIGTKLIIALIAGYVLSFTIFKNEKIVISSKNEEKSCENDDCKSCHHHKNIFITALIHSLKICLYIFATLLVIQLGFYFIGEENLSKFLLSNNIFQPVLAAIFGLIPGCGTSVLVTQLYLNGSFSFASCIAGLCTGAGFGYLILFNFNNMSKKEKRINFKKSLLILFIIVIISIISGMIINLFKI